MPVLSTHSTSTRARVSMAFISWISVRFRASRTTLTARATLVSRNSPSGIMPIRAATVETTDCRRPSSWIDELVVEQRCADGDQHDADEADQAVQGAHHLAFAGAVILLGRQRQLGGVGVCPHLVHPGPALAGDDEAAGQQLVPRLLGDGVRLAGDEGLVHLHLPGEDRSVRRDLAAGGELHHVLPHQLVHRQLPDLSVPNDPHLRGGEEGQLLNGAFGAQLLDDADDGIGCHDEEEGHVLPVPHQQQAHRQNHENQVEVGEDILPDDLLIAFGGRLHRAVVPAGLRQGLSLGGGEAAVRLGGTAGHLLAASGRGLRGGRFPVRFHGHSSFDKI